ncbi:MAG: hypothetical protein HRU70_03630 [Phycisphaeraceae bacterium]|nr:MAG: hypothetical protein HRU70_03630 [Phycisphaeraceae bacterium]
MPNELIEVFGRLHPAVLHMPFGLLAAVIAAEVWSAVRPSSRARDAAGPLLWLTVLAAAASVVSGITLAKEGTYAPEPVDLHRWLGIAAGALILCSALAHALAPRKVYLTALVLAALTLAPAGHFGGELTHGPGFLLEPLQRAGTNVPTSPRPAVDPETASSPGTDARTPSDTDDSPRPPQGAPALIGADSPGAAVVHAARIFETEIRPILASACVSCHTAGKRPKGRLALDTPEGIAAGGRSGPALIAGDAGMSEIVRRLRLPLEHRDHMPPRDKPQPTEDQIRSIEAWIDAGAAYHGMPDSPAPPRTEPESPPAPEPSSVGAAPARPTPDPAALAALASALVHTEALHAGSGLLRVDAAAVAGTFDDEAAARLLAPLLPCIDSLALARSRLTDRSAELLASMPRLTDLDLRGTAITTGGLAVLARSPSLRRLNLASTGLDDGAADVLAGMPALTHVYLWRSGVSPAAADRLRAARPSLVVDLGESDPPSQAPREAPSLAPVNTVCPVSGGPVDPAYLVVHGGRVIGFCCPKCPSAFWENPSAYVEKLR